MKKKYKFKFSYKYENKYSFYSFRHCHWVIIKFSLSVGLCFEFLLIGCSLDTY